MTYEEFLSDTLRMHQEKAPKFAAWPLTGERRPVARPDLPPVDAIWYFPEHREGRLPVLVNTHGGGFTACDAVQTGSLCRTLADRLGALVVSVNYRKAPEFPFPYAIDETCDVVRYIADNATKLGIDAARIAVIGQSAGASLAASVALKLAQEGKYPPACQVLIYPCTDLGGEYLGRHGFADEWLNHTARAYRGEADAHDPYFCQMAAPKAMLERLCPTIILTCDVDELQIDGERYAQRLVDANVPVTLWRVKGTVHGYLEVNRPDWGEPDDRIRPDQDALARKAENYIVKMLRILL